MESLERFEPKETWLASKSLRNGPHGLGHLSRVLVWSNYIARQLAKEGRDCNLTALRWAASLHDCRRYSDNGDVEHGVRAGKWIAGYGIYKKPPFEMDIATLQTTFYCCAWHTIPISQSPKKPLELYILKEADTLDFIRFGPDSFDDSYLYFDFSLSLVDKARRLVEESTANYKRLGWWKAVRESAIGLGVWE